MQAATPAYPGARYAILAYGAFAYVLFLACFVYAIGFVGNIGVPRAIDGSPRADFWTSLLVDLGLLGAFAVQHSVMARPAFKRWWTRIVPAAAERSTYVLLSSLALFALFAFWHPLGGQVWQVSGPAATALNVVCAAGWLLVLVSTFLIDHFDLFGLRQVWIHFQGRAYVPSGFRTPGPYRWIRHPLYLGWFLAFWATPSMTATHLLFALATAGYILIAIQLEERDLVASLGQPYADYRRRVPMLIPRLRPGVPAREETATELVTEGAR